MPIRYLDDPPASADLVIIGGGVVGAATAFHASRAGMSPVILEARPQLCTLTTPVAAGGFRLQFDDLEELELVRASAEMFLGFEEITRQREYDIGLDLRGYLWLTTEPEGAASQRDLVARLHGWGQTDVEIIQGDEVRERWPWVSQDVVQARWRGDDGFLDTKRLTFGLATGAGAQVVTSCEATGFAESDGRLTGVLTSRGGIDCAAAVICAGPLSGLVASKAGLDLPIVTVRRQKLMLPVVPEVPSDGPMLIDEDTGAHWRPAREGAWLLFTDPSTPPTQPTADVPTDHGFAFQLLDPSSPSAVARVVPFWQDVWERGSDHWVLQAGQYTVTPDRRPIIGETEMQGLFVNTGYSGHGIMLGPAAARISVQAIVGDEPHVNRFRPDRAFVRRPQTTL
jgi:sarcosine oxidase subunit beta